jgi:hypothetical protein
MKNHVICGVQQIVETLRGEYNESRAALWEKTHNEFDRRWVPVRECWLCPCRHCRPSTPPRAR